MKDGRKADRHNGRKTGRWNAGRQNGKKGRNQEDWNTCSKMAGRQACRKAQRQKRQEMQERRKEGRKAGNKQDMTAGRL